MNQYPYWPPPYPMLPQNGEKPLTQKDIERGVRIALQHREHNGKIKAKRKELKKKAKAAARSKAFTALEWFTLGVVLQPFVYIAYKTAMHYLGG